MRRIFLVVVALFLAGCTVPGTYMASSSSVTASARSDAKGQLLHAKIIPVDDKLLRTSNVVPEINAPYKYRVGPYDVLNIVVWNHPELTLPASQTTAETASSITMTSVSFVQGLLNNQNNAQSLGIFVNANGEIIMPLLGKQKVSGLSVDQISSKLTIELRKYIRNPQVSVSVSAFNSKRVHVIGEVMQPGMRPLTDRPLTVLDALNLCGGINTNSADVQHIYIIRSINNRDISVYWLNARSPQALLIAERFRLVDNDIIYVSPAGVVSWNRIISQILPTIETIWYTSTVSKQ
ncbi:MAG: polysaccharide biosynthesis/export family protein [Gammaproteobacteria bacterium]|nr:polysaccharide biosynthesis/export family protein [Gammaproteobacteria bacterium]